MSTLNSPPQTSPLKFASAFATQDAERLRDTAVLMKEIAANRDRVVSTAGTMMDIMSSAEEQFGSMSDLAKEWVDLGLGFDESIVTGQSGGDGSRDELLSAIRESTSEFDITMLGPELKATSSEDLAAEIQRVLLRREQDFTDALVSVGRDDFMGEPLDNAHRNTALITSVVANAYSTLRSHFVALGERGSRHVYYYKGIIRALRSMCFLTKLVGENLDEVDQRIQHLELLKDKYDATIFTLRRQLQDFHRQDGTVGRGSNGAYQVLTAATMPHDVHPAAGASSSGAASATGGEGNDMSAIVILQVENFNQLRGRHQALYDATQQVFFDVVSGFASSFDLRRTNFTDSQAVKNKPASWMFVGEEAYQAVAFATAVHAELAKCTKWPQALVQMGRYSGVPPSSSKEVPITNEGSPMNLWAGLRIRCGVHYGVLNKMDIPEATSVVHVEGVQVEKCMRIAALASAGETIVSTKLWERYQAELVKGIVPTNRNFHNLRQLVIEEFACGKRRGFRKGENCWKLWDAFVKDRRNCAIPVDVEFEVISFFGLEAGGGEGADDEPPSPEELLFAKDTEIAVLQNELDQARLAMMKRESDWSEIRSHLLSSIEQLQAKSTSKIFYHTTLSSSLEAQLLAAHECLSSTDAAVKHAVLKAAHEAAALQSTMKPGASEPHPILELVECSSPNDSAVFDGESEQEGSPVNHPFLQPLRVVVSTPRGPEDLRLLDDDRRKKYREWVAAEEEGTTIDSASTAGSPKHKNVNLWRQLNKMVNTATQRVAPSTSASPPLTSRGGWGAESPSPAASLRRSHSTLRQRGGGFTSVPLAARFHSILRVYAALVKRFIAMDENASDSANQAITDDQFMHLFLRLMHPEGIPGNMREYVQLMSNTAIDDEAMETANQDDDSRLLRSAAGHLARMFLWLRQFKRKAVLDANLSKKLMEEAAAALAKEQNGGKAKIASASKTGSSKSSLSAPTAAKGNVSKSPARTPSVSPSQSSIDPAFTSKRSPPPPPLDIEVDSVAQRAVGSGSDLNSTATSTTSQQHVQKLQDEVASLKAELQRWKKSQTTQPGLRLPKTASPLAPLGSTVTPRQSDGGAGGATNAIRSLAATGLPNAAGLTDSMESNTPSVAHLIQSAAVFAATAGEPHGGQGMGGDETQQERDLDMTNWFVPRTAAATGSGSAFGLTSENQPQHEQQKATDDPVVESPKAKGIATSHTSPFSRPSGAAVGGRLVSPERAAAGSRAISPNRGFSGLQGQALAIPFREPLQATAATGPGSALQLARAHRAAPHAADLQGFSIGGTTVIPNGVARPPPPQQQQPAPQVATVVLTPGTGMYRSAVTGTPLQRTHPVLHPLRNTPNGTRSISPAKQQPENADPNVSRQLNVPKQVSVPVGMSVPSSLPPNADRASLSSGGGGGGASGRLFFALNARDVQRQLDIEDDERQKLAAQQRRIQEQLVMLRQLQAENQALINAGGMHRPENRPPTVNRHPAMSITASAIGRPAIAGSRGTGGSSASRAGDAAMAPSLTLISAAALTATTLRHDGSIGGNGLASHSPVPTAALSTAAVEEHVLHDAANSTSSMVGPIDVPSAQMAKNKFVAQIVAKHR